MAVLCRDRGVAQVHHWKTGGTWVTRLLMQLGGKQVCGGHGTWAQVRPLAAGLRAVATVRNPWDWYASFYGHAMAVDARHSNLLAHGGGSMAFRDVLWGLTHPTPERMPREPGVIGQCGPGEPWIAEGCGLATWSFRYAYAEADGSGVPWAVPTDRLAEGWGLVLDERPEHLMVVQPPANTRWHRQKHHWLEGAYRDFYDDEMVGWVAEADAALIEWGGWEPWTPTGWALREVSRWP